MSSDEAHLRFAIQSASEEDNLLQFHEITVGHAAPQKSFGGVEDAFVTKFSPAGSALGYSTYLGGGGNDYGMGIAPDATGDAYVTGVTESADFPLTRGAFQRTFGGVQDAFVTRIATQETFASLTELVKQFETKPNVAAVMVFTLELARVAKRAHDAKLADALLDAFIDEVKEQSGKSLTTSQAAILILDAKALMIKTSTILKRKSDKDEWNGSWFCFAFERKLRFSVTLDGDFYRAALVSPLWQGCAPDTPGITFLLSCDALPRGNHCTA